MLDTIYALVDAGVTASAGLKSVLDRLGNYGKFVDTLLGFGVALSEVSCHIVTLSSVSNGNDLLLAESHCKGRACFCEQSS